MEFVDPEIRLAASRDGHLALRRVERQQVLIERLHATARKASPAGGVGARALCVGSNRRPRLRAPPDQRGSARRASRGWRGVSILPTGAVMPIAFDLPEIAALMSSLAVLGPIVSESATSAMRKLADALSPASSEGS